MRQQVHLAALAPSAAFWAFVFFYSFTTKGRTRP
jgi:hypothetical protein